MYEALAKILNFEIPPEDGVVRLNGTEFTRRDGILRAAPTLSPTQSQTARTFGYKWHRRETFESDEVQTFSRDWLVERYDDARAMPWLKPEGGRKLVLEAGCGGGNTAIGLLGEVLHDVDYVGVEISEAIDVAADRFASRGYPGAFLQTDLNRIPLPDESVDVILSDGVLHHTDSTRDAILNVARKLKPGGRMMFYVYRKRGPIREFSNDLVRREISRMNPDEAWQALFPLTKLGVALGDANVEIEVPEEISFLGIPAGRIDVQRLIYWHFLKLWYRPEMTLEELNHVNFDWFMPENCHRQTPEEVRTWCAEANLELEREVIEDAGITVIARKRD